MSDYSSRDRGGRDSGRDRDDRGSRGRDDDRGGRGRDDDRGSRSSRDDDRGSRDRDRGGRDDDRGGRDRGGRDSSSGSSRGFVYKGRDKGEVEKRASQSSKEFDRILKEGVKMWTPNDKDNRIRFLPATWEGAKHYGMDIYIHYGVGPDRASYLDLYKMLDKPDPITEEMQELQRNNAHKDDIRDLDSKKRVLVYIIDRDNEGEGVQAWSMPWGLDKDISVLSVEKDTGKVIDIDDPDNGFDVEFRKSGQGIKTEYSGIAIARRPSPLGKSAWLDYAIDNPLPDQLQYFSYDEINKVFSGGGAHREGGDDSRDRGRDDRPSRDDDRRDNRDTDRESAGRGGRDDDRGGRGGSRDRNESDTPALTWKAVHDMTGAELDALVDQDMRLHGIKVNDAKSDAELADWICEDLKISKEEPEPERGGRSRVQVDDSRGGGRDEGADKLARMREERGGRR